MNSINGQERFADSVQHTSPSSPGNRLSWPGTVALAVALLGGVAVSALPASAGTWTFTGDMVEAQPQHSLVKLADGRVLAAGGLQPYDGTPETPSAMDTAEIYDPATGQWSLTGSMNIGRFRSTLTLLPDGKVLAAGGRTTSLDPTASIASAEIYDPATGQWTLTGSMDTPRQLHTASLLPDGRVLVTGGRYIENSGGDIVDTASAEIYDPAIGQWTPAGEMSTPRERHSATPLPDGTVLVTGGSWDGGADGGYPIASAEIYDPAAGQWSLTGSMSYSRILHGAVLLNDGTVLVAGGASGGRFNPEPSFTAEVYDPASGIWTQTGSTECAHSHVGGPNMTALPDGTVLLPGADYHTNCSVLSAEIFTPGPGTWALTGAMNQTGNGRTVLLDNGTVLATKSSTTDTQIYTP